MDRVDKLERKLTHKEDELGMLQVTTTNTLSPEPGNPIPQTSNPPP